MKIDVISIVRALDLGEYHVAYAGQAIQVWVSAPAEFLRKRDELLVRYSRRFQELQRLQLKAMRGAGQRFQFTKVLPWQQKKDSGAPALSGNAGAAQGDVEQAVAAWNAWLKDEFLPLMHAWFAELLSQGEDPETHWTAAELDEIHARDTALLEWMKRRSLEMVQEYAAEKKRPSEPPSSD